jgi:hypothetical protein
LNLEGLAPELDDALMGLRDKDRRALLPRFFKNKSFREVARELEIGEDAAQKRVAKSKSPEFLRHRYLISPPKSRSLRHDTYEQQLACLTS